MGLNTPGNGGLTLANGIPLNFSSNSSVYQPTVDVSLIPDAAGILAQRNGSTPQEFRIYNSYTNATNYERVNFKSQAGAAFLINSEASGMIGRRNLEMDFPTSTLSTPTNTVGDARTVYLSRQANGAGYIGSFFEVSNFINLLELNSTPAKGQNISFKLGNSDLGSSIGNAGVDLRQLRFDNKNTTAGSMTWVMGGAEAMRLTQARNVGIGTSAPTANFEVAQPTAGVGTISIGISGTTVTGVNTQFLNTFKVGNTITASGQTLTISAVSSNTLMTTTAASSDISGAAYTLAGGSRFGVYGNGNVGIGTTTPAYKLSISDTNDGLCFNSLGRFSSRFYHSGYNLTYDAGSLDASNNAGLFLTSTSVNKSPIINFINSNAGGSIYLSTNASNQGNLDFSVAGYGALTLRKGDNRQGNAILSSLTADATYNNASLLVRNRWDGSPGAVIAKLATSTTADIFQVTNESLSPYFNVTATGNVGIGTTTPSGKLDILDTTLAGSGLSGSVLNLNQTWNTTGIPTAIKLNVTDTASNAASNLMDLQVSGNSKFRVDKNGNAVVLQQLNFAGDVSGNNGLNFVRTAGNTWRWGSNGVGDIAVIAGNSVTIPQNLIASRQGIVIRDIGQSVGAWLLGEASDVLAQRGATNNPQAYRLYNTYTSATNFERLNFRWDSLVAKIGTDQGSVSGLARDLVLETSGTERVRITASGLFSADGVSFGKGRAGIATNIAIGQSTLVKNISGSYNLAIGRNSLAENTNGNFNVAIGEASLRYSTVGSNNIAIGQNALINNIASSYNVAVGQNSFSNLFIGAQNVSIGQSSLGGVTEADNNVAIGYNAGLYDASLSDLVELTYNSVFIGANASALGAFGDTNSIAIGYSARGMGSNTAVFGNDGITDTYLKGIVQIPRFATSPYDSERIAMRWNGLTGTIGTSKVGTGLARPLAFETNGISRMTIATGGNVSNSALFSTSGLAIISEAPVTATDPGVSGQIAFSSTHIYRHIGSNWQRAPISFASWL